MNRLQAYQIFNAIYQQYPYACFLDSCHINMPLNIGNYQWIWAVGNEKLSINEAFNQENKDWYFGIISYDKVFDNDLKKTIHSNSLDLPEYSIFKPTFYMALTIENILITNLESQYSTKEIKNPEFSFSNFEISQSKNEYLNTIENIKRDISNGDVYEINHCIEIKLNKFNSKNYFEIFTKLISNSPAPMSGFYKHHHHYLICGSPERFFIKKENKIVSQPIKGTRKPNSDPDKNSEIIKELSQNLKDKAENIMIVDLVRNDLSKISKHGSINVSELMKIYTYPNVIQMVSSIQSQLKDNCTFYDIFNALFPMGSMTGAPKIAATKFINLYENHARYWFSGTLFYKNTDQVLDSNVIIRSLIVNDSLQIAKLNAGGAITIDSEPEQEWQEVILKLKPLCKLLNIEIN